MQQDARARGSRTCVECNVEQPSIRASRIREQVLSCLVGFVKKVSTVHAHTILPRPRVPHGVLHRGETFSRRGLVHNQPRSHLVGVPLWLRVWPEKLSNGAKLFVKGLASKRGPPRHLIACSAFRKLYRLPPKSCLRWSRERWRSNNRCRNSPNWNN
jgi:hypothetical protein